MSSASRVLIIGGGFAGAKCAGVLRKKLPPTVEVVLFNRENHLVFHPLLPEVAGASINPDAVAAPLRQMLPGVFCRTEDVQRIELAENAVVYEGHDGVPGRMAYDHVVVACGQVVNLGRVPGMADHAFPLKTIGDAIALRAHVIQQMEKAEVCDDRERQRWYLTFIVVGGGYSGVESAGEINDLVRGSRRFFRNIAAADIAVKIIHSRDVLLPDISPTLGRFARVRMERAGVEMIMPARVGVATPEGVTLQDGRAVRGATVVSTVGSSMATIVERLEVEKERGRILTDAGMRIRGHANAWSVGDCAAIINAHDGKPSPPTAQFAERQGRQVAENILRVMNGEDVKPFHFKPVGQLCSIGGHQAVAEVRGRHFAGFFAWLFWKSVYLFKLPSWSRRVKVGFDWAWELLFSRELAHLKTDKTERVSHAYYQAGDYIFRQGDPGTSFYAIEKGDVEVLRRSTAGGEYELLAVLGAGDFFGEMALIENQPRNGSVRARTPVEVVVIGRDVFSQMSKSLTPLRDIVAGAVKRRAGIVWANLPAAHQVLAKEVLASFIEPPPGIIEEGASMQEAIRAISDRALDIVCVLGSGGELVGVLTRSDLLRAVETAASVPSQERERLGVRDFMTENPAVITEDETVLLAAATMRERGLMGLPVVESREHRRLVGYVRIEKLMNCVLEKLPAKLPEGAPVIRPG